MNLPFTLLAIAVAFCLSMTARAASTNLNDKCLAKVQSMNQTLAQTLLMADLPTMEISKVKVAENAEVSDFGLTIAEGTIEISMALNGKVQKKEIKTATTLVSSEVDCAIMGISR